MRGQAGDHIRLVDVGLVAHAQESTEADAMADGPVDDAPAQRARLRKERDATLRRHALDEGGVQWRVRVDNADAIRSHDADTKPLGNGNHLVFARKPFRSDLPKAAGDDDGSLDPAPAAGLNGPNDGCRGDN